ncbi:MAG TPA: thioredoxin family protein [Thermoanaerobaculia bacterium]|nr:thioredoxin family protein [Thermoanaerobaculia bacterium]
MSSSTTPSDRLQLRLDSSGSAWRRLLFGLLLCGWITAGAASAQDPSVLKGFQPDENFILEVNGERDEGAEIYVQQRLPAYLVLPSKASSPVLLVPRTKQVQAVHIMKMTRRPDGFLDLAPDAVYASRGQFELEGTDLVFEIDGTRYTLKDKPALLGLKVAADLKEYADSYVTLAQSYTPSADALSKLEAEDREILVRVYFGSWCPFCQRYLPRMVRVADELAGSKSKVAIDFYGFPQDFSQDSTARTMNIRSVPTGVVFIDGKEAGRIQSEEWQAPEKAVVEILGG